MIRQNNRQLTSRVVEFKEMAMHRINDFMNNRPLRNSVFGVIALIILTWIWMSASFEKPHDESLIVQNTYIGRPTALPTPQPTAQPIIEPEFMSLVKIAKPELNKAPSCAQVDLTTYENRQILNNESWGIISATTPTTPSKKLTPVVVDMSSRLFEGDKNTHKSVWAIVAAPGIKDSDKNGIADGFVRSNQSGAFVTIDLNCPFSGIFEPIDLDHNGNGDSYVEIIEEGGRTYTHKFETLENMNRQPISLRNVVKIVMYSHDSFTFTMTSFDEDTPVSLPPTGPSIENPTCAINAAEYAIAGNWCEGFDPNTSGR